MNRLIIVVIFLFVKINLQAQFTTPLPDSSASWTIYANYQSPDPPFPNIFFHNRNIIIKDTLIDTLTYFKIGFADDLSDTTYSNTWLYRIDSLKVFFRETNGAEYLRYDFGMQIGDSIAVYQGDGYARLDSIDNFTIQSGQTLTRYLFSCSTCFYFTDAVWFYGIGSYNAPFLWQDPFSVITSFYYKNECYIFDYGTNYDSTLCLSANLLKIKEEYRYGVTIYPNPSIGTFYIESDYWQNAFYELFDLNGKLIQSAQLHSNRNEISTPVEKGIFVLRVRTMDGTFYKKIVITE